MRLESYIGEKQSNDIFNDVAVKNLTSVTPISDIYSFDTKKSVANIQVVDRFQVKQYLI